MNIGAQSVRRASKVKGTITMIITCDTFRELLTTFVLKLKTSLTNSWPPRRNLRLALTAFRMALVDVRVALAFSSYSTHISIFGRIQHRRHIEIPGNFGDSIKGRVLFYDGYHSCLRPRTPGNMLHKTHACRPAHPLTACRSPKTDIRIFPMFRPQYAKEVMTSNDGPSVLTGSMEKLGRMVCYRSILP